MGLHSPLRSSKRRSQTSGNHSQALDSQVLYLDKFPSERESFKVNLISGLATRSLVKKDNSCLATFLVLDNKKKENKENQTYNGFHNLAMM